MGMKSNTANKYKIDSNFLGIHGKILVGMHKNKATAWSRRIYLDVKFRLLFQVKVVPIIIIQGLHKLRYHT